MPKPAHDPELFDVEELLFKLLHAPHGEIDTHDHHYHRCANCGNVWDHKTSDADKLLDAGDEAGYCKAFREGHTCQRCGEPNCTWKYFEREEAIIGGHCQCP